MGFSFLHFVLATVIVGVVFGPKPFRKAGKGAGEFWRGLKRGLSDNEDIDVTSTIKRHQIEPAEREVKEIRRDK